MGQAEGVLTSATPGQITANALARRALGDGSNPRVGRPVRAETNIEKLYTETTPWPGHNQQSYFVVFDFLDLSGIGARVGFGLSAAGAVGAGGAEAPRYWLCHCVFFRWFLTPPKPTERPCWRNEARGQLKRQA